MTMTSKPKVLQLRTQNSISFCILEALPGNGILWQEEMGPPEGGGHQCWVARTRQREIRGSSVRGSPVCLVPMWALISASSMVTKSQAVQQIENIHCSLSTCSDMWLTNCMLSSVSKPHTWQLEEDGERNEKPLQWGNHPRNQDSDFSQAFFFPIQRGCSRIFSCLLGCLW